MLLACIQLSESTDGMGTQLSKPVHVNMVCMSLQISIPGARTGTLCTQYIHSVYTVSAILPSLTSIQEGMTEEIVPMSPGIKAMRT